MATKKSPTIHPWHAKGWHESPHLAEDFDPSMVRFDGKVVHHPDGDYMYIPDYLDLERERDVWRRINELQRARLERGEAMFRIIRPPTRADNPFPRSRHLVLQTLIQVAQRYDVAPGLILMKAQGTRAAKFANIKKARARVMRDLHDEFEFSHGEIARAVGFSQPRVVQLVKEGRAS